MSEDRFRILTRDAIKYVAMLAMLLNHIAEIFLTPGTVSYTVLRDSGYFTAITMCYFLVEGYGYTRSKRQYAGRLLLFAVISELPYCLAFDWVMLNMLCTLFICFLIIYVMKERQDSRYQHTIVAGLILLTGFRMDWGLLAPVFTVLFVKAGDSRRRLAAAWCEGVLLFGLPTVCSDLETMPFSMALLDALGCMAAPALGGVCILFLYNGKRAGHGRTFSKWFFYLFYPVHLTVLALLRIMIL